MMNTKQLYTISEKIQSYCINKKLDNGYIKHYLPTINENDFPLNPENWDLDKATITEIKKGIKQLNEYADKMIERYCCKQKAIKEWLLPPCVVFPLYSAGSLGWRMGSGEIYVPLFVKFFESLNYDEKEKYKELYPMPEYIKVRYGDIYAKEEAV